MKFQSIITIDRHFIEQEKRFPYATGEFTKILYNLSLAAKIVTRDVRKAGLVDILGITSESNSSGEVQKKLDMYANDVFVSVMNHDGIVCALASEENDGLIELDESSWGGRYVVIFDPLDGSSNIDANVSIGTIFSIYKRVSPAGKPSELRDVLQPGYKQIGAGYVIYGSSTMFVYTTGNGVHGFTYDPSCGEFLLSHPNMKTPDRGSLYSINEGNWVSFSEGIKSYISWLKETDKPTGRPYSSRYIGSLVADFHRNLLYGGIYIYPGTEKSPQGKLRLLYECNPLAMIIEQAGGKATNGTRRILDLVPKELHERSPLFIGSPENVDKAMEFLNHNRV